jgi:phage/plasmid-associated DNA primase
MKGIFAFAIEGLKRLQKNKYDFSDCPAVEEQRDKIGKTNNLCSGFASMCLEVDDADYWVQKTKKSGKIVLTSSAGTRSSSDDLFASFIGWCLKNQYEREAKVVNMASFLKDFRTTLQDKYDFGLAEEGKSICENESTSNNVLYFHCVRLNDNGEEYIAAGQKFIELHNLRNKRPDARQNTRTGKLADLELEV